MTGGPYAPVVIPGIAAGAGGARALSSFPGRGPAKTPPRAHQDPGPHAASHAGPAPVCSLLGSHDPAKQSLSLAFSTLIQS